MEKGETTKGEMTQEEFDAYKRCRCRVGFMVSNEWDGSSTLTTYVGSDLRCGSLDAATNLIAYGVAHLMYRAIDDENWLNDAASVNRFLANLSGKVLRTLSDEKFCDAFRRYRR